MRTLLVALACFGMMPQLSGQATATRLELSAGVARLYHATGAQVGGAVMLRAVTSGRVTHWLGLAAQYSASSLGSADLPTREQRHLFGVGAQYEAQWLSQSHVAPFVGVSALFTQATISDNPFLTASAGTGSVSHFPEDRIGDTSRGWSVGPSAGVKVVLQDHLSVRLVGYAHHQSIYSVASTHTTWGLSAGIGFGP